MGICQGILLGCLICSCKCKSYKLNNYLGTEEPYVFRQTRYTPPPQGYYPIYINHLGRHGARYLSEDKSIVEVYDVLREAKQQQALTAEGEILLKDIEKLMQVETGKYGLLTPLGVEMEQGIAKRMYHEFPGVFGKDVVAVSTYVERTKESMHAFLDELGNYIPKEKIYMSSNGKVDPVLRFFDLNREYVNYKKDGYWKEAVKKYEERRAVSSQVLKQFFSIPYLDTLKNQVEIASSIYSFYTNQFNVGVNVGLGKYFTRPQLKYYWENKNVSTYLEKGPSNIGNDLPTNIAFGLLGEFIMTTEEAIEKKNRSANLRFAHAETIIPFASLLKLGCCSKQTNNLGQVASLWKDYEVSPMAANIQWIIYENKEKKDYLIKMLYNEREIEFPIYSPMKPYYQWDDVKTFYTQVLCDLNIDFKGKESLVHLVETYKISINNDED